jgi:hypothetical protein
MHTSEIFIENGRFHGRQIVQAITGVAPDEVPVKSTPNPELEGLA